MASGRGAPLRVLFVCARNRLRSPSAEQVFAGWPGIEVDSAGVADDAEVPVSSEQVEWADVILVMERSHAARLRRRFGRSLGRARLACLDIPDRFAFMDPELVGILRRKVPPQLR